MKKYSIRSKFTEYLLRAIAVPLLLLSATPGALATDIPGNPLRKMSPPPSCLVEAVSPLSLSFIAQPSGSQTLTVTTLDDCVDWIYTKSSGADWISASKGSATLTISCATNTGAARSASITIGNAYTVTVTQAAGTATLLPGSISCSTPEVLRGVTPATITGTAASGGSGTLQYTWQYKTTGGWTSIGSSNTLSYSPPALTQTTAYRRMVTAGTTAYSNEVTIAVVQPGTSSQNFVRSYSPSQKATTETALETLPLEEQGVTLQYFDGLGRPLQTVAVAASPTKTDIVTPVGYDALGREHRKYLPYAATTGDGRYHPHNLSTTVTYRTSEQFGFYSPGNAQADVPDSEYPYAETVFENSPLNRVTQQGAPGLEWQPADAPTTTTGHTVRMVYGTNMANSVVLWGVDANGNLVNQGYYLAGKLSLTTVRDENWTQDPLNTTEEYKDLQGRVVLKRTFVVEGSTTKPVETYYVYDDLGLLRVVIPPLAVDELKSAGDISWINATTNLNTHQPGVERYQAEEGASISLKPGFSFKATSGSNLSVKATSGLTYRYRYDGRGRMVEKKLPGAEPVYMVYDRRDRLVLTQDGNQRAANQWLFTLYDTLNRPAMSGMKTISGKTHTQLQTDFAAYTGRMCESTLTSGGIGYTATSFSSILGTVSINDLLTVTYYDGYTQLTAANGFNQLGFVSKPGLIAYAGGNSYFSTVKGLVTGTKTRVLDTNEWLYGVTYYDDRYRPIQTRGTLYGGAAGDGYTTSMRYDFPGKVMSTEEVQVFGGVATTTTTGNTYDHAGRLLTTTQQVTRNGTSTGTVTLAQNQYNALGQLKEKNLANGRQSVDYTYNIRGWLKGINNPDNLTAAGNGDTYADLFGMRLNYNEATATGALPQFNGNIAEAVWNTNYDTLKRSAYGYSYDALNRLTNSDYWTTVASALTNRTNYEERGLTYDLNGNIKTLIRTKRNGDVLNNLTYTYSGNRLSAINGGAAYAYDRNGNMTTDGMRGFSVEYNLLNLPKKVSKDTSNISYIYSATGVKLAMLKGTIVENYYAGTCVYKGNKTLDYALHPEGVVRATAQGLSYEYFLKDHLGNTRVVFNSNGTVLQTTDYYAFGLSHTPLAISNTNRYLYNGKEQQDAKLGDEQFDWYDYGARFYDPTIARWTTSDPLCEVNRRWSPYRYAYNNPLRFIDPDGMLEVENDDWWVNEATGELTHTAGDNKPKAAETDDNIKYLGEDGMFGILGGKIEYMNEQPDAEKTLTPETSKKLAESAGYKAVPVEEKTESNSLSVNYPFGKEQFNITSGKETITETKISYVPMNNEEISRNILNNDFEANYNSLGDLKSSYGTRLERISYGNQSNQSEGKIIKALFKLASTVKGNHDYTEKPVRIYHPIRR